MGLSGISATPTNGTVGYSTKFTPRYGTDGKLTAVKAVEATGGTINSKYGIIQSIS
jgi:hypothetical protein